MALPQENSQSTRADSKRAANDNTLRIEPRYPEGSGVLSLDARRPNRSVRAPGAPAYDPYPEPEEDEYGFSAEDFPEPANDFAPPPPEQAMYVSSPDRAVLERRLQTLSRNRTRESLPRAPVPPQKHYRVDRVMGAIMTLVALFFDLLAVIIVVGGLALLVMGVSELASKCGTMVDRVLNIGTCLGVSLSLLAGGGAAFFLGPGIIGFINMVAVPVMAFVTFTIWFWLAHIPPFSLKRLKKANKAGLRLILGKRIAGIIISIIGEAVTIGLFPGITLLVFLNVRSSRKEDEAEYKSALESYTAEKKEYDKKYASRIARARAEEAAQQRVIMELEQAI